jgi:hypothetical protein
MTLMPPATISIATTSVVSIGVSSMLGNLPERLSAVQRMSVALRLASP